MLITKKSTANFKVVEKYEFFEITVTYKILGITLIKIVKVIPAWNQTIDAFLKYI